MVIPVGMAAIVVVVIIDVLHRRVRRLELDVEDALEAQRAELVAHRNDAEAQGAELLADCHDLFNALLERAAHDRAECRHWDVRMELLQGRAAMRCRKCGRLVDPPDGRRMN